MAGGAAQGGVWRAAARRRSSSGGARDVCVCVGLCVGRYLVLRITGPFAFVALSPFITVSNKVSLQNQLQNPALVILKNLMRSLTVRLEDGYCSITVAIIN